jgi:hypothetical protein
VLPRQRAHGTLLPRRRFFFMSWMQMPESRGPADERAKQAILANVQRGLVLASASRRLQDSISSRRASSEARQLLNAAKRLCEETPDLEPQDERIRMAIASLTRALESA